MSSKVLSINVGRLLISNTVAQASEMDLKNKAYTIPYFLSHVASSFSKHPRPDRYEQAGIAHEAIAGIRLMRFTPYRGAQIQTPKSISASLRSCIPKLRPGFDNCLTDKWSKPASSPALLAAIAPPAGSLKEPSFYDRHPPCFDDGRLLNRTHNLVFRTLTKPSRGLSLSTAGKTRPQLPADFKPAPDAALPCAPQTVPIDKPNRKHVRMAARKQARMLSGKTTDSAQHCSDILPQDLLTHPKALAMHASRLFALDSKEAALQPLLSTLHRVLQQPHSAFTQSRHLILLQLLAQVCAGDPTRALAALQVLLQGAFLPPELTEACGLPASPATAPASMQSQQDALSVAARLSTTAISFNLLRQITPLLPQPQQQARIRRLLQACAQIETEQGRQGNLPDLTEQADLHLLTGHASLAQAMLHFEMKALQQPTPKKIKRLEQSKAYRAVRFAWDNGFREDGPGSELARVKARLYKMLIYIKRAEHMQALRDVHFDHDKRFTSALKVIDASLRIAAAHLNRAIGRKKSPLSALAALGINNAGLKHPEDDLLRLFETTQTSISLLYAHLLDNIQPAQEQEWQQAVQDSTRPLPIALEHAALLGYWLELQEYSTAAGQQLDRVAVRTMAAQIATQYACPEMQTVLEQKLSHWIGYELSLDDLQKWAADYQAIPPQQAPAGALHTAGPNQLARSLHEARQIAGLRCRPEDQTPLTLQRFITDYLLEHNVGHPVTLTNGGAIGLNTLPFSFSFKLLNQLLHFFAPVNATPMLDMRISRMHNAMFNFGSTSHGFELFIGTQTQSSGTLGAAVSVAPHPFFGYAGLQAGAGVAGALGADYLQSRGVMIRAARDLADDGSSLNTAQARETICDFTNLLFDMARGEHGKLTPDSMWSGIAEHFFENQSLSIGLQEQHEWRPNLTGTASAYSRIGVGSSNAHIGSTGIGLAHTVNLNPAASNSRQEQQGRSRLVRNSHFIRRQHINTLGAVGTGTSIPLHTTDTQTESLSLPQVSSTLNYQSRDQGFSATFRTIIQQDQLSPLFTLRDLEYRDNADFLKALRQPERYAQYLQVFSARYGAEHAREKLEAFIEQTQKWDGSGQHYLMRSRIKMPVLEQLNELHALRACLSHKGAADAMPAGIGDMMSTLLQDENSWVPTEIMALEGRAGRSSSGINFGLQLASQHGVVSDRELSYVAAPLSVANAWVRAPAAAGPA